MVRGMSGKRGRKKSSHRTKQAPGTMKHHPGHRSRSHKIVLTPKRWAKKKADLFAQALKEMSQQEAEKYVQAVMETRYKMRTRRKR